VSHSFGNAGEMERFAKFSDEELEQLLAGRAPTGNAELEALAGFATHVPAAYAETPRPELETIHLARIVEAVRLASDPATAGLSGSARKRAGRARRRRTMLATVFSTLAAKIAITAVAAAAATGGLAATGNLGPAQDAVASAVSHVGLNIPHGKTVSDTARNTDKTGREKGQEVSKTASTNSLDHRQDAAHRSSDTSGNPTGNGSPTTPSGNPTGFGQDTQPSGNPTGFGQDSQPSGNPTGFGDPSHPTNP
jgi:hypothetical protein